MLYSTLDQVDMKVTYLLNVLVDFTAGSHHAVCHNGHRCSGLFVRPHAMPQERRYSKLGFRSRALGPLRDIIMDVPGQCGGGCLYVLYIR